MKHARKDEAHAYRVVTERKYGGSEAKSPILREIRK